MNKAGSPSSASYIHPDAEIEEGVEIGPFCHIGPHVKIGAGCVIKPYAMLDWTKLAPGCVIGAKSVIGGDPQFLNWKNVESWVEVGEGTLINELTVVHRSIHKGQSTIIGANCFIMSQTHIGHDCVLGDEVTFSSLAGLSGHVRLGNRVVVGGGAVMHQFVRVGDMAMVGGASRIVQDVLPCFTVTGNPAQAHGLNTYALRKFKIGAEDRTNLKRAYKILVRSGLAIPSAAQKIEEEMGRDGLIGDLLEHIAKSERGLTL
ncbi:MAG: acyl-ACP--UDP-N-acetylglucosamine O-acyltransferase [Nitrospinota bacterium]|nr:acyl-ACP--UDP-N-acetylglucosamine O-acyltransferase [Nitrospinota bacterium]MDH5677176.1 acyl-ACP--UDP-N-acetylglucosamine O-acyltransferase [Nitrospinota bacterium]MDH5755428.1 acyl-ACP--UDP-N-acetylglucosamine O-acyltransferase [Nitrospinota bacterium]